LAWLRDWLQGRAPAGLQVKGLLCQAPARLRGRPVGELRGEMDACDPHPGQAAASPGAAPGGSLRVRWPPAAPGASLRLSWFRPGGGSVTETLVRGERGEYLVTSLQPRAAYRVCLSPLDP
ncbi:FLRT1 protein, partial [Galbula dea]|nr:FLRT1 protein [Galbula dea]